MNKTLNNMEAHKKLAKELGLKPMFSREELAEERAIRNGMKLICGVV